MADSAFFAPDVQQQQIDQRRAMAQALLEQGQQNNGQTQQIGGVAIRNSPISGLANMLGSYLGARGLKEANQQQSNLSNQRQQAMVQALQSGFGQMKSDPNSAMATLASNPDTARYAQALAPEMYKPQTPKEGSAQIQLLQSMGYHQGTPEWNAKANEMYGGGPSDYQNRLLDTQNRRLDFMEKNAGGQNNHWETVQSPDGSLIRINPATGAQAPFTGDTKGLHKPSAGGGSAGLGGRESVMFQRVVNSANSAATALQNISELPVGASTGVFGVGASPGHGLLASAKGALTNTMASQDVQDYNTMLAGVGRNLATIETAGLAPNGSLTSSMDSIQLREGDTHMTKLRKLAEMRQIIEKGIETNTSNPKLPQEQKDLVNGIIGQVKKAIPFTQSDITKLQRAQEKNPGATLQDIIAQNGLNQATTTGKPALTKADSDAIDWANQNPNDPRAAQIKQLHGVR